MKEITRFELINKKGREIVLTGKFKYSLQDDERTLKVFIINKKPTNKGDE